MKDAGFKKITFKNGLRLILVPRPGSLAATVLILVEAGSEYEAKRINGISHFLEHMVFKGTAHRPKPGMIAEELAGLGAQFNAFTSQEYTGYWAKVESCKLPKIVEIVSDLYLNPIFNPEEIEKERGVIIEEINMYEDTPMRRVQELFSSVLYGDQPAGWDVAGEKGIIRKLTREDFLKYREARYLASGTVVVVAGNFKEKDAVSQILGYFGRLERKKPLVKTKTKEKQNKPQTLIKFKKSDQGHLILGVRSFDIFDRRRYILQVLADTLGGGMSSRLFKRVREELGAAYYINAGADFYLDHGYLAVSAGVDHQKIELVIKTVLEEFKRLSKKAVPARELQRSKDHLIGNLVLGLETSDELAAYYGEQEILTGKMLPPHDLIAKIQKVRAEEVQDVARNIFSENKLNLAVIGPYKKPQIFRKMLEFK